MLEKYTFIFSISIPLKVVCGEHKDIVIDCSEFGDSRFLDKEIEGFDFYFPMVFHDYVRVDCLPMDKVVTIHDSNLPFAIEVCRQDFDPERFSHPRNLVIYNRDIKGKKFIIRKYEPEVD